MSSTNTTPGATVRHFKGSKMKILHEAVEATTGKDVLVYIHLDTGAIWTRPTEEFNTQVRWPDGITRSRFIVEDPES